MTELNRIYWTRFGMRFGYGATSIWLLWAGIIALQRLLSSQQFAAVISGHLRLLWDSAVSPSVPMLAPPVALLLLLAAVGALLHGRDLQRRDPVRRFSRTQGREGMARANGQCELESSPGRRCSRPAEHGDHFYPWSKGGATSLQNFVAACATCNRRKGARIPSPLVQRRLERRRLGYFAADTEAGAGERRERKPVTASAA